MATVIPSSNDRVEREPAEAIDLRSIGAIFRRRLWTFLLLSLVTAALAFAFVMTLPDRYTATSSVLLDRRTAEVTEVTSVLSDLPADSASVDTEVQVLRSPANLRSVAERLKLQNDPEFNGALQQPSAMAKLRNLIRNPAETIGVRAREPMTGIVGALSDAVAVSRNGLTYVISVEVTTLDPAKSARIANAVAAEYIARQVGAKRQAAIDAQNFLRSRLSGLGAQVQGKEAQVESLRARAGLPSAENQTTFDQQLIGDTSRQVVQLQSELAQKRGQLSVAESARNNPAALPAVIESAVIRDLKARRAETLANSVDVSARYGPLHPETRRARDALAELDREIAREMASIISSLRQEVAASQSRLSAVSGQLAQQQGSAIANSRNSARVQQLDREALASRGVYEGFLKRSEETSATEDLVRPDASIVNLATPPLNPSQPNRPLLLMAGLILALGLGCIGIIVAELVDIKISSGADIERYLGLNRLASVPNLKPPAGTDSHALLITQRPRSSYAEAYRDLSDLIGQPVPGAGAHVVMISSAVPHEGKTAVASSLALSLASARHRVLLIDADLRRPQVLAALQLSQPAGAVPLDSIFADQAPVDTALVRFSNLPLDVLPLAAGGADVELFRGDTFAPFLKRLRSGYDYIVIDTPPILALSDGRHLSHMSDEVIFVTRWRTTSRFAAKAAVQSLKQSDAPVSGVVLNAVDLKTQSLYARDDSLAFYNSHRSYYTD